ncbi:F420-0--gamma-glutamyl ligase [Erysipelothrix larvae]|uniref:F420-0--gamma-glutamyl ligase n=1 Tax=Erysipelothrix larvae TaxID=1514105 RepID=A0A109UGG1_9FIRM|nr:coenzyme F420-0:L-glutamate ligase [Erysipelothrix larvae]AMC92596.1 F420-0--gamma-glutamyl ligase [Erysipelothrix larvae]
MDRKIGTVSRGIRCPIIKEGDNLVDIVVDSVTSAQESGQFTISDRDIVCITESIVARAQGNYASIDAIAQDVHNKFKDEIVGITFPILSRNRFSTVLKGIARGSKHIVLMLSYPSDEVGNALLSFEDLDKAKINPYSDTLTLEQFKEHFGSPIHPFTGMDYVSYYKEVIEKEDCEATIIFSNHATKILDYTKHVLTCDIHTRARTKQQLLDGGAKTVYGLDDILSSPINGSGYNDAYGLLGSNKATEDSVKLFPRDGFSFVDQVQKRFLDETGKHIEVMIFGDGAFKDPMGKIWELADPTVAPGYTQGLEGTPNELKLKYLADNEFKDLTGEALRNAIMESIHRKADNLVGSMAAQGTTPRRLVDLIGSLCDLTSGSGDKGTPVIHIQGYFDNYASE